MFLSQGLTLSTSGCCPRTDLLTVHERGISLVILYFMLLGPAWEIIMCDSILFLLYFID